jgi:hypothetical protein
VSAAKLGMQAWLEKREHPSDNIGSVGNAGRPGGRFRRAIARGNLLAAESAAREIGRLSLEDALETRGAHSAGSAYEGLANRLAKPGLSLLGRSQLAA